MEVNKKRKKSIPLVAIILIILTVILVVVFTFYAFRYSVLKIYYTKIAYDKVTELNLSTEEKLEDFEFMFDTLISGMPLLEEYAKEYDYYFEEKKDTYISLIESTESDFEFYCTMYAILQDIPSGHTSMIYPDYYSYNSGGYGWKQALAQKNVKEMSEYFYELIKKNKREIKVDYIPFFYRGEKYISDNTGTTGKYRDYEQYELCSLNGISPQEYLKNIVTCSSLKYSEIDKCLYKSDLILNDSHGDKVNAVLRKANGEEINEEFYFSVEADTLYSELLYSEVSNAPLPISYNSVYSYVDEKRNLGYLYVSGFRKESSAAKNAIAEMSGVDNIIIDVRTNGGGQTRYWIENIYQPLFSENLNVVSTWYTVDNKKNYFLHEGSPLWSVFLISDKGAKKADHEALSTKYKWKQLTTKETCKGKAEKNKNVYILTSNGTFSAADGFVYYMKKNNLATIIGSNTGGEGLSGSYIVEVLPNSKLVFRYMPSISLDAESPCGTSPHILVANSVEDISKNIELIRNNEDASTYENRLKWDSVLLRAIEEIEKKQ